MTTKKKRLLAAGLAAITSLAAFSLAAPRAQAGSYTCDDKACDGFTCVAKTASYCNDGNPNMCITTPCSGGGGAPQM